MSPSEIASLLRSRKNEIAALRVVTCGDAFVDEIINVVAKRESSEAFLAVASIGDFAANLAASAGHSGLREIVVNRVDAGGCAINMGDGLVALGVGVDTFATVGSPVDAAFADYAGKVGLHNLGIGPGRTLAFEFQDGKLMFSSVSHFSDLHSDALRETLGDGILTDACAGADLLAITNWSLYPHMTACWQVMQDVVLSKLTRRIPLFLDLVDPSGRTDADIVEMLKVLSGFEKFSDATLGLNQNEANILCRILNRTANCAETKQAGSQSQAIFLRRSLGISEVVIHTAHYAAGCSMRQGVEEAAVAASPYCEAPKKSTGAGDRFNAGYAFALLLGLPLQARLTLANAVSGLYVRQAHSATLDEVACFMEAWEA